MSIRPARPGGDAHDASSDVVALARFGMAGSSALLTADLDTKYLYYFSSVKNETEVEGSPRAADTEGPGS